jgi:hypothetical protein
MIPTQNTASSMAHCPRCGSPWFAQLEFRQYAEKMYSSTVGGSLTALSDPQSAPVCLCGMLFRPGRYNPRVHSLSPEQKSFRESWERAQEYLLRQSETEERTQKQLQAAADPEYIKQLSERLDSAEKRIDQSAAEIKGQHLKSRRKPGRPDKP